MDGSMMVQVENMLSASNEWPQKSYHQIKQGDQDQDDEQIGSLNTTTNNNKMMMVAETKDPQGGGARLMEKPTQEQIQQQQQQQPLKCPRCESTNTKFCYYNNYSLSQPRHFCKACKRYWTRGGTLRSVPVGGGCRKNKRIRRINTPNFSTNSPSNNSSSNATNMSESSNTFNHSLNPSSGGGGGAHFISPLLYGLPTNLVHPNHHHGSSHEAMINGFQFSSSYDSLGGGINGLGFSSGGMILGRNGYSSSSTPKEILQDLISNSNTFHGSKNSNTTTTCSTSTTTLPTMSSMSALLTSSSLEQHQQKFNFETLFPYESDLQMKGVGSHGRDQEGVYMKEDSVKLDGDDHPHHGQCQIQNGYDDQIHGHDHHHQQQPMGETDPSILWNNNNNSTSIGVNWLDPNYSSLGSSSSVPSLI